jgi:hypothetical protein
MILYLTYNNNCQQLLEQLQNKLNNIEIIAYNEDVKKERKKAFGLKGNYGAKESPFSVLYNENKPIKAFYTEVKECTLDNIINYLNTLNNGNTSN